jgi:peptidoglycan-N-acetylglucosamine deacetylase
MMWKPGKAKLVHRCTGSKILVLTYDDGPGERLSSQLMRMLGRSDAKATFFLLGFRTVRNPAVVDDLRQAGHELCCHTHDHTHAWKTRPSRVALDIDRGYETLSKWVPANGMFRPPYGKLTPWSYRAIRKRGARIGWWTIDSGDTWADLPEPESVVGRVQRAGGGVVLMHDFDRDGPDRGQRETFVVRTTELLLEMARREGFLVCTLGEMLDSMDHK